MNTNSAKVQSIIENTLVKAIEELTKEGTGTLVSDLYVQVDLESGELQVYDDSENLLGKNIIFDWVNKKEQAGKYRKTIVASLKAALTVLSTKGAFNNPVFLKPLSVSLTDEYFTVTEELLFLDDELFRLDDPLLKDLDADLDEFLNNLLSDIK